jgi:hypothetical protein
MKKKLSPLEELARLIAVPIALLLVVLTPWKLEGIAIILTVISANLSTLLDRYLDH